MCSTEARSRSFFFSKFFFFLQNLLYKYYDCGHSNYNSDYSSDKNAMYKRTPKVEVVSVISV